MVQQTNLPILKNKPKGALKVIISAWLLAGTLDITAAIIYYLLRYEVTSVDLLQYISSGVFGRNAFAGGIQMAFLGLLFHYLIALIWTFVFFVILERLKFLAKNRIATGIAYGIFVSFVMNLFVVPLSKAVHLPFNGMRAIVATLFLIFCIGLPISAIVAKFYLTIDQSFRKDPSGREIE